MNAEETLLTGAYENERYVIEQEYEPNLPIDLKDETKFLLASSGPLVVTFFLQYLISVTSIYAAGKLGPKELAAASLAICTFNISGLAVYQGMATSLDTFCSQAYGSGKYHQVGVYFQRCSLLIMAVTIFPLAFIWWFSGSLLKYLVPDLELAMMTQQFLRLNMIGTPGLLLFETGKRFLQAQHIFNAGTYVLVLVAPLNFLLNWILVWHPVYGLGFIGAPIATSIVYWCMSLLMLCYVLFVDGKKCWGGLEMKALQNWGAMLQLAVPGVIMVEAEYLAFEILTIFAASFGTEALAAQSIASNVGSLAFQLPFAFAVAIATRIGHFIGMSHLSAAKLVVRLSTIISISIAILNFCIIFFGKYFLSSLFTDSKDVLKLSSKILTLVAINQLSDSFNVLGAGILRGQGRQKIGSFLNIISYYVIAVPVGYFFAFGASLGLVGLWLGLILGVLFLTVSEYICIYRSDWSQILIDSRDSHDH